MIFSLLFAQITWAWGGIYPSYQSPLAQLADSVEDPEIKKIISENIVTIINNNIQEDYQYNPSHFYTKKLAINVEIPEKLKNKIKSIFLGMNVNQVMYYDGIGGAWWGDSGETIISPEDINPQLNHINIPLSKNNIPWEITIERAIFDNYFSNEYGDSFLGVLYIELEDGTILPFSNTFYIYINANTHEWKSSHLQNLYYQENNYMGYADVYSLLQKLFEQLREKLSLKDYITLLNRAIDRASEKMTILEEAQKKATNSIEKEEDFSKIVKSYWATVERYNTLNDIRYQIASEVKTKESESIIEDLFSD